MAKTRPIGSRFEFEGLWYEVVPDPLPPSSCKECDFYSRSLCSSNEELCSSNKELQKIRGECARGWRTDNQSVIFQQVKEDKEMSKKYVELDHNGVTFNDLFDTGALCASWKDNVLHLKSRWRKAWDSVLSEKEINAMLHEFPNNSRTIAMEWLIDQGFCRRIMKHAKIVTDMNYDKGYIGIYAVDADEEWKELLYAISLDNGKLTVCGKDRRTRNALESSGINTMDDEDVLNMAEDDHNHVYFPHIELD